MSTVVHCFILYTLCLSAVQPMEIAPKVSFTNPENSKSNLLKLPVEVYRIAEDKLSPQKLSSYKRTVIIKEEDGDSEENVVCKHDKCIVTVDANISDKKLKGNKVSTDVHVIVSSDIDPDKANKKSDNADSGEVPVFKGYNGVRYEDINWKNQEDENKARNENEEPSSIIRSPYNGEEIIINPTAPNKPVDRLTPPELDWNRNYPNNNEQKGVRIPSGWTSNWKPSYPSMPGDNYPYNGYGDRKDSAGFVPTYRNVCKCTREPVYPGRADFYPKPPEIPWYPIETTTKQIVDDKLSPPFSVKQKRSCD